MDDVTLAALAAVLTTAAVLISMLWLGRLAPLVPIGRRQKTQKNWPKQHEQMLKTAKAFWNSASLLCFENKLNST